MTENEKAPRPHPNLPFAFDGHFISMSTGFKAGINRCE
jgi:hypothetical protein